MSEVKLPEWIQAATWDDRDALIQCYKEAPPHAAVEIWRVYVHLAKQNPDDGWFGIYNRSISQFILARYHKQLEPLSLRQEFDLIKRLIQEDDHMLIDIINDQISGFALAFGLQSSDYPLLNILPSQAGHFDVLHRGDLRLINRLLFYYFEHSMDVYSFISEFFDLPLLDMFQTSAVKAVRFQHAASGPSDHNQSVLDVSRKFAELNYEQYVIHDFIKGYETIVTDCINDLYSKSFPKDIAKHVIRLKFTPLYRKARSKFEAKMNQVFDSVYGITPPTKRPRPRSDSSDDRPQDEIQRQRIDSYVVLDMDDGVDYDALYWADLNEEE